MQVYYPHQEVLDLIHFNLCEVKVGQLIMANLDLVLGNDITTPVAINSSTKWV
ncbi:hypothetical protein [Clostridium sp.]|uniref:hypothetical protein n=1 Tax=Clostridium sp. TaxID=1506 RepID=UPI003D6CB520